MSFIAPTRSVVVPLRGGQDAELVQEAVRRLESQPGLGAVILGEQALVAHERLLAWVPRLAGEGDAAWVGRLRHRLVTKGYRVEHVGDLPMADPPVSAMRSTARAVRRLWRTPLHIRALQTRRRWRRFRFIRRLRYEARLVGARVHLDVSKDLSVQPGVRIQVRPQGATVRIGPYCAIGSGVILRLGGELDLVTNVDLRHDVALNVKGRLQLQGRNVLGRGTMVHADGTMTLEWGACTSEYVTILDSHHEYDGSLVHVHDQGIDAQDTTIGAGTLLGARTMVMPGVRIGRTCLVGAGSVVTKDVPDGWIARGAPAKPVRPVVAGSEPQ